MMQNKDEQIVITPRDRVLRAWQNSTELVRDYQLYAKELGDNPTLSAMFHQFAEEECHHASRLRDALRQEV